MRRYAHKYLCFRLYLKCLLTSKIITCNTSVKYQLYYVICRVSCSRTNLIMQRSNRNEVNIVNLIELYMDNT